MIWNWFYILPVFVQRFMIQKNIGRKFKFTQNVRDEALHTGHKESFSVPQQNSWDVWDSNPTKSSRDGSPFFSSILSLMPYLWFFEWFGCGFYNSLLLFKVRIYWYCTKTFIVTLFTSWRRRYFHYKVQYCVFTEKMEIWHYLRLLLYYYHSTNVIECYWMKNHWQLDTNTNTAN